MYLNYNHQFTSISNLRGHTQNDDYSSNGLKTSVNFNTVMF